MFGNESVTAGVGGSTPSLATMFSISYKKLLKLPQKQNAVYRGWNPALG